MPFHDLLRTLSGFALVTLGALLLKLIRCCDLFVTFGVPTSVAAYAIYLSHWWTICDLWGTLSVAAAAPCALFL